MLFRAVFRAMLRVSFALLLLYLYDLETNRNWRHWLHCQQHALMWMLLPGTFQGKRKFLTISSMLFSASRGAGQIFLWLAT